MINDLPCTRSPFEMWLWRTLRPSTRASSSRRSNSSRSSNVSLSWGLICANAGVDRSNSGEPDRVVLLPSNLDETARRIRAVLAGEFGQEMAVLIADTQGRPFRVGATGTCIGIAGMAPLCHLGGCDDLFGYTLQTTVEAVADELCAAATLVMGQCDEGTPLALIQGYAYQARPGSSRELLLKPEHDLFRS